IRKVTSDGTVTTLVGTPGAQEYVDGVGTAAHFYFPSAITRDAAGNLFVTDSFLAFVPGGNGFSAIRKITPDGVVTTLAGSSTQRGARDGVGSNALFDFSSIGGLAIDASGTLYVADTFNGTIRKVTPDGTVSTIAG